MQLVNGDQLPTFVCKVEQDMDVDREGKVTVRDERSGSAPFGRPERNTRTRRILGVEQPWRRALFGNERQDMG